MFFGNQYVGSFKCDGDAQNCIKPKGKTRTGRYIQSTRIYKWARVQAMLAIGMTKKCTIVASYIVVGAYIFTAGVLFAYNKIEPRTVWAKETIEVPVREVPPVMRRIAKCESGDTHYRNGQVIFNANSNGSIDRGRYQINSVWDKKATELGYDLANESDNEQFAMWLYENRGTADWYSSASCWNK